MSRPLTSHQRKIVERYYEHKDTIMVNKLAEIVSELYVADDEKKRARLWDRVERAMKNLKTDPKIVEAMMRDRKVEDLARFVQELE